MILGRRPNIFGGAIYTDRNTAGDIASAAKKVLLSKVAFSFRNARHCLVNPEQRCYNTYKPPVSPHQA